MADNVGHTGQVMTTTFESNWYWYFESLFWPEQIMRIREICERREEEEALTSGTTNPEDANHKMRKNKVSWHDNEELYSMLRAPLNEVNQQSGWNYNITAIEPVQYTVYYGDENHYHWHTDTITNDQTLDPSHPEHILKNTIRKISCSVQLTDPREYDGGEFELMTGDNIESEDYSKDLKEEGYFKTSSVPLPHFKEKGSAMFFPSFTYHRVKPVTKGIRRSLVVWFRGPKWQ
jgi:PKHD-type hydroxylase